MKYPLLRGALGAASVTLFVAAVALAAPPVYAAEPMEKDTGATQKSKGTMADDTMITTKVKAAFVKDETVHALKIKVTTNNGIVQLSGFAGSAQEAERATEVARQVPGVKDVKSDIKLRQGMEQEKAPMKEQGKGY